MSKDIPPLEQKRVERLTEIGNYLRQVREESLFSLDQVAAKTMIPVRLLQAIEHGHLNQLPEPVYIQGFIKRYADVLGLDGPSVANAFPTEQDSRTVQPSWKDSPEAQLRPLHLYVAYVCLIVVAVSMLSYVVGRSTPWSSPGINAGQQTAAPAAPLPSATPQVASSSRPEVAETAADSNKPVRVDINLTAQSWLRIVADGKTEFEGVLPEGTQRTWSASSQLIVRAGNAGGVMLTHNDGQAELMGEPGAVEELTFSVAQRAASLPNPPSDLLPQ
ncbi:helix-turn-helix domain-containing protein [Oculatella sp. LEGE 06141]|uniref:helix-turn-helix domain-containing protein n=1 Tax=Oculatella sp. LEGE 06141 TaxID=1828648 RepID=UPI0018808BEC|nr:RodZ domain-containing protein [Oculatella sp. LEGE 06141]MBE9178261.1 helix-turn-helix domain-containing protein [Oculatella sp. LEGE 06141]